MQEIDELVDRKGIRINWQIPPPHAFAHSLTFERIFSVPFFFFDLAFLQLHADDHSRNAKRAESSLFKRFASKYRLRVLRSK